MVDGGFRGARSAVVRKSASPTDTCLAFVRALDACWDQQLYEGTIDYEAQSKLSWWASQVLPTVPELLP
jgi:hypothetical protein